MGMCMGQVLMGHRNMRMCACVVVGADQFGHFFVCFGGQLQVFSGFAVVLLRLEQGGRGCRCHGCFGFECHGKNFQKW